MDEQRAEAPARHEAVPLWRRLLRQVFDLPRMFRRPGRNAPCRCGSGLKYKRCCLAGDDEERRRAHEGISSGIASRNRANEVWDRVSMAARGFLKWSNRGR